MFKKIACGKLRIRVWEHVLMSIINGVNLNCVHLWTYRKVPKVTTLVTLGFNSLFLSLLSEGRYFQGVATFG